MRLTAFGLLSIAETNVLNPLFTKPMAVCVMERGEAEAVRSDIYNKLFYQ